MGKKENISNLYQLYKWELFYYIRRVVKSPLVAEDIMQEVFYRLCRIESLDDIENFRSFLFITARNLSIDHIRKRNRSVIDDRIVLDDLEVVNSEKSPEDNLVVQEDVDRLYRAIRSLPKQRQRAFIHKKILNRSYKEISCDFGTAISTLEKHVRAAMADCKRIMNDQVLFIATQEN